MENLKYKILFFILLWGNILISQSSYPSIWTKIKNLETSITNITCQGNDIYVGTDRGLWKIDKGVAVRVLDTIGEKKVLHHEIKDSKNHFVLTPDEIVRWAPKQDSIQIYTIPDLSLGEVCDLVVFQNHLWLTFKGKGIYSLEFRDWDDPNFFNFKKLKKGNFLDLDEQLRWTTTQHFQDGKRWLGTYYGMLIFDKNNTKINKKSSHKMIEHIIPHKKDTVYSVYFENENYYASKFFLKKDKQRLLESNRSKIFFEEKQDEIQAVHEALFDLKGQLWLLLENGIGFYQDSSKSWKILPRQGLNLQGFSALSFDNNGDLWVGTKKQGLYQITYPKQDTTKQQNTTKQQISYDKTLEIEIKFDVDSCNFRSQYTSVLSDFAKIIRDIPEQDTIIITGHTSKFPASKKKWAIELSLCRAESIKAFFVNSQKIANPDRVVCFGKGDTTPKYKNPRGAPTIKEQNRRVEILLRRETQE